MSFLRAVHAERWRIDPTSSNDIAATRFCPASRFSVRPPSSFLVNASEGCGDRDRRGESRREPIALSIGSAHFDALAGPRSLWLLGRLEHEMQQAKSLMAALPDGLLILEPISIPGWDRASQRRAICFSFCRRRRTAQREATVAAGLALDYLFFRPLLDGARTCSGQRSATVPTTIR